MNDGSIILNEVIEALKFLDGSAKSRQIEDYIIEARGGILPKTYEFGGWDSYRKTINQMIQYHCHREPKYKKYRGPAYFKYLGPGYYELLNFRKSDNFHFIETRKIDSYKFAKEIKIDEEQLEKLLQKKKEIGALGEEIVVEYETKYLFEKGRPDLAKCVRQISKESVGEGYDIISYDLSGNKKFIEVKSTKSNKFNFFITDNELTTAKSLGNRYWIYRVVFLENGETDIYRIQNPVQKIDSGEWCISPLTYLVQSKNT